VPTFNVYVPTRAHQEAVKVLERNKIVLLLGDPATGKSTIAAVLGARAASSGHAEYNCFNVDDPRELLKNWNPNEEGSFYWIDYGFGANQLREDFVESWLQLIPRIQAATNQGNYFVITSRRHIYEPAKRKLGGRNHPYFKDSSSLVNVGCTSLEERKQILYNHIKASSQVIEWKKRVKPFLETLAKDSKFIPEIARRLADPYYTQNLSLTQEALIEFVREPKEHLCEIINGMSVSDRAALTLVLLHRGALMKGRIDENRKQLIEKYFSVSQEQIGHSIANLQGSFLIEKLDDTGVTISFKHPTIADALNQILGKTDGLTELYIECSKIEALLGEIVCEGVKPFKDAVIIPQSLNEPLIERILEAAQDSSNIGRIQRFLAYHASDEVCRTVIVQKPKILTQSGSLYWSIHFDSKIKLHTRALSLGVLPDSVRRESAARLETALFQDYDVHFLSDNAMLSLFKPDFLIQLKDKIKEELLPNIPDAISDIEQNVDYDDEFEPDSVFEEMEGAISQLGDFFSGDDAAEDLIYDAENAIYDSTKTVSDKQKELSRRSEEDHDHYEEEWREHYRENSRNSIQKPKPIIITKMVNRPRSTFSDIDE